MFAALCMLGSADEKVMVLTVVMPNDYGGKRTGASYCTAGKVLTYSTRYREIWMSIIINPFLCPRNYFIKCVMFNHLYPKYTNYRTACGRQNLNTS